MIFIPWDPPYRKDQLDERATPTDPSQPECFPDVLYSTVQLTTGDTGPFMFFGSVESDKTLSNQQQQNALPLTQYFIVQYVTFTPLRAPVLGDGTAVNPAIADLASLLITNRAILTIAINAKSYGPFHATDAGADGGLTGFAYAEGATAAGATVAVVNNGAPGNSGFPYGGALILSPQTNYEATLTLASGGALVLSAPLYARLKFFGVRYRQVR